MEHPVAAEPRANRRFGLPPVVLDALLVVVTIVPWYFMMPPSVIEDVKTYHRYAEQIVQGGLIPYRDFAFEYPSGSLVLILVPRLFYSELYHYFQAFATMTLALHFVAQMTMLRLFRNAAGWRRWAPFAVYTILAFVMQHTFIRRLDAATMALTTVALGLVWRRSQAVAAGLVLGVATSIKLYPALLVPLLLAHLDLSRNSARLLVAWIVGTLLMVAPWWFISGAPPWSFLDYHLARGLQQESLLASGLYVASFFGYPFSLAHRFKSEEVSGPWVQELAVLSTVLMAVFVIVAMVIAMRRKVSLAADSLGVLAAFILFNRVLSPQYITWLIPFVAFLILDQAPGRQKVTLLALSVIITCLTAGVFPGVNHMRPESLVCLVLRNLSLLILFFYWLVSTWRWKTKFAARVG